MITRQSRERTSPDLLVAIIHLTLIVLWMSFIRSRIRLFDITLKCLNEGVNEYGEIWNIICNTHFNVVGKTAPLTKEEIHYLSLMILGFLQGLSCFEEKVNA